MADVTISSLPLGAPSGNALLPFSNGASTSSVPVSAMFHNAGNIGIGTTSPSYLLDLRQNYNGALVNIEGSSDNIAIRLKNNQTGGREYRIISTAQGSGYGTGALALEDQTSGSARMVINNAGNVGIGTTAPTAKLDVAGDVKSTNTPKAWVNWNGKTFNAQNECVINASYNISKVVRDGEGKYTVYFSTPSPVTNQYYVTFGGATDGDAGAGTRWLSFGTPGFNHVGKSTTSFVCEVCFTYTNFEDAGEAWVSVIGN
jgi:hypothetical protein